MTLSGCDSFRNTFGLDHYQPDEFKVSENPPLSIPKDYKLRPPAGSGNGSESSAFGVASAPSGAQAQNLLLGSSGSPVASASKNQGEQNLLAMASSQQQAVPDIRETVNREAAVSANLSDSLIQKIMSWKEEAAQEDMRRVKEQITASLQQSLHMPQPIARETLQKNVYGENHPYYKSIKDRLRVLPSISGDQLKNYMKKAFTQSNLEVIVCGAASEDEINLGKTYSVSMDIPQTLIYFVQSGIPRLDPDIYALLVGMRILGSGDFESRLWQQIRENMAGIFNPQVQTLPNGLKVIVVPNDMAPIVNVGVLYMVGTADDPPNLVGISHFLEHMMFKGTNTVPTSEFKKTILTYGGSTNASTSFDYTLYNTEIAKEHLELILKFEADRMVNLAFTEAEVKSEKDVVWEERRMRFDNHPFGQAYEVLLRALSWYHPYGVPPIGYPAHIQNYSYEAVRNHYNTWYAPNNAVLIVAGKTTLAEVMKLAEKHFGGNSTTEFYKVLVEEKKLAIAVGSSYEGDSFDPRPFSIAATLAPHMDVATFKKELAITLQNITEKGVSEEELRKAKRDLLAQLAFIRDGNGSTLNVFTGLACDFTVEEIEKWGDYIQSVTLEQVHAAAKLVLGAFPILTLEIWIFRFQVLALVPEESSGFLYPDALAAIKAVCDICDAHQLGHAFCDQWLKELSRDFSVMPVGITRSLAAIVPFCPSWLEEVSTKQPIILVGAMQLQSYLEAMNQKLLIGEAHLKAVLESCDSLENDEVNSPLTLVLAADMNPMDAEEIAKNFYFFNTRYLITTRMDVTKRYGGFLSAAKACSLQVIAYSNTPTIGEGLHSLTVDQMIGVMFFWAACIVKLKERHVQDQSNDKIDLMELQLSGLQGHNDIPNQVLYQYLQPQLRYKHAKRLKGVGSVGANPTRQLLFQPEVLWSNSGGNEWRAANIEQASKNNMDPFYATGVVMMARTKEELTFNRGSLCRDGLASRKQWLREEQTLTSRDGGGACTTDEVGRVWIPKGNSKSKRRPLSIACIKDRVVQTAMHLILQPIFEADLLPEQYGFRPDIDAKMAVRRIYYHVTQHKRTGIVDADLKDYFTSIPHKDLIKCLSRRIVDKKILGLIKQWTQERSTGVANIPIAGKLLLQKKHKMGGTTGYRQFSDEHLYGKLGLYSIAEVMADAVETESSGADKYVKISGVSYVFIPF
eukprot:gene17333-17524_t